MSIRSGKEELRNYNTHKYIHIHCEFVTSFLEIPPILGECWMDVKWDSANKLNTRKMFWVSKIPPKQSSNYICTLHMLVNMSYRLYIILHSLCTQ